jgi:hypothetical protein
LAPLTFLAGLVPSLAGSSRRDPTRALRSPAALAVLVPSTVTVAAWFFVIPDPRFALAAIWLVPLGLAAWLLPPAPRLSPALVAGAVVVGAALATVGILHVAWLLPATLLAPLYLFVLATVLRLRGARGPAVAAAAMLVAAFAVTGVVADRGTFRPVVANGTGPFGTTPEPLPALTSTVTRSGLRILEPVTSDQCYQVLLCAPAPVDPNLHLRGATLASGLSVGR